MGRRIFPRPLDDGGCDPAFRIVVGIAPGVGRQGTSTGPGMNPSFGATVGAGAAIGEQAARDCTSVIVPSQMTILFIQQYFLAMSLINGLPL